MQSIFNGLGFPIRKSADQFIFANPRSLSQLITSFIASESQGIPRVPFLTFFYTFRFCSKWYVFMFVRRFLVSRFQSRAPGNRQPVTNHSSLQNNVLHCCFLVYNYFFQYVKERYSLESRTKSQEPRQLLISIFCTLYSCLFYEAWRITDSNR